MNFVMNGLKNEENNGGDVLVRNKRWKRNKVKGSEDDKCGRKVGGLCLKFIVWELMKRWQ